MRKTLLFTGILCLLFAASAWAGDDVNVQATAKPKIVHMVKPEYPAEAKAAKITGAVKVQIEIQTDGSVKVLSMTGPEQLQAVASAAVSQWRYEPVVKDGKPIVAKADVEVNFALAKDEK